MIDTLLCPNCGTEIEVSTVLSAQLREHLRKEYEIEVRRKEADIAKRGDALGEQERVLAHQQQTLEQEITRRLAQEESQLLQQAQVKAKESLALEFGDLQSQLDETKQKLGAAQQAELQLRKDRRQLETQKGELELAFTRKLDEERNAIRQTAKQEACDENRLREADRDNVISTLRRQIDDLKRKSEQGSCQAQGEVMELVLEDALRHHFPLDTINDVPVGVHGGDLLHHVFDTGNQECGIILWESKRTKSWSDTWLPKLRDDQRAAKAHLAILVTAEMPRGCGAFGCIDGVWIAKRQYALGLAIALRTGLLEVARMRRSLEGRQTKVELLYQYVTGSEFRQRVEGIVEAFVTMKTDLEAERRAIQRLWTKRERQLDRVITNTSGLHGDLGGILGSKMPAIDRLELAELTTDFHTEEMAKAPWE